MTWDRPLLVEAFSRAESRLAEGPLTPRSLRVEPLSSDDKIFAAVDSEGAWVLVVATRDSGYSLPPLKLSSLSADYGTSYELHGTQELALIPTSVVRCTSRDPAVRDLFATFCHSLLGQLPEFPTDSDVENEVNKWVRLFWRLQSPPRTTLVGLIGELTILDEVEHINDWVRAWHMDSTDNLDFAFSTPPLSVEVKTTTGQQRVHDVSLHQLAPEGAHDHFFASVIVELRGSGTRLGDVVDEIAESLKGQSEYQMFWNSLASVCGTSLGEFLEGRYMRTNARNSIHFYAADSVPSPVVDLPLPLGVSKLRFRSDFSSSTPIDAKLIFDT